MGQDHSHHHRGHGHGHPGRRGHGHRGGRGHPGGNGHRGWHGHGRGRGQHHFNNRGLHQQAAELERSNAELTAQLHDLSAMLNDNEPRNALHNVDRVAALIGLADGVDALPMNNRSFGFFGLTSTGKSTIVNKLLGMDVAEVGAGETTTQIKSYEGRDYTLYDIPGLNDHMSYFTMEYISFWKGLTGRLVVITATVKEMLKVLRLFEGIGLDYDIIVNKLDDVEVEQRDHFKETIRKEVGDLGLKNVKRIWFVSAKNPELFADWIDMINNLLSY